ncbi:MAG: ATP-binding cassette domain-containing protein [Ignavibacteria bacterium]|nr:ATP-binding cassette domain-containing protein [Ignavibacteria bacterium]
MVNSIVFQDVAYNLKTEHGLEKPIIRGLSGSIDFTNQCRFTTVLGANGAGKSTLARLICQIIKPSKGIIRIQGIAGAQSLPAFIPGEPSSLPWLSVKENIKFVINEWLSSLQLQAKIKECLALTGLEGYEEHYPVSSSFGFQLRLSFARAISANSEVIIIDDYFKNLGISERNEMITMIKSITDLKKICVILLTSDVQDAISINNETYYIDQSEFTMLENKPLQDIPMGKLGQNLHW